VTYFPYSQLSHYLVTLTQDNSGQDAFQGRGGRSRFPAAMPSTPFSDAINNPSAPFGAGNPPNGCHAA
jgi:hypothetical protein